MEKPSDSALKAKPKSLKTGIIAPVLPGKLRDATQFQDVRVRNKTALSCIYLIKQLYVPAMLPAPGQANVPTWRGEEVRAMESTKFPESRPYWIRYLVTFWAGEELKWARDKILVALVCSLTPGLIVGGISAALSNQKWRAAAHATLLTYGGLFALFLIWRLVATPLELDRERQRFISGLTTKLAFATFKVAALQASAPAVILEILEIHIQGAHAPLTRHTFDVPTDCDIFLRVKLTLRETRPLVVLAYELSCVLHGNSLRADYVDDIQDWGLVTEKRPVGIGTTFHYTVTRLTKLAHRVEQRGVPVEGWLHFCVKSVHEKEIGATVYRLTVETPNDGISTDMAGAKSLAGLEGKQFQKIPYASGVLSH